VKVLRPGIADQVRQDLNLLETLIRPLGAAFPPSRRGCHVPAPVSALCHERVLVSAWVDGTPVGALTDPAAAAAATGVSSR